MVVALVATLLALAWLTHRASKLLAIPIPVLVKGLGLDIPAPPRVSLHNISADSIELHWSPPEKAGSVAKHIIQINGQNVGENERRDTSVVVTGLSPDQIYNVRVIAANSSNFQAPSPLIRLRTLRSHDETSRDGINGTGFSSGVSSAIGGLGAAGMNGTIGGSNALGSDDIPTIHATDTLTQVPQSRRTFRRQHSPNTTEENLLGTNGSTGHGSGGGITADSASTDATVEALTAELEKIQREAEELEASFLSQEEEHKTAEALLLAELEGVRDKKKEEDNIRSQLRTETRTLEDAKRAAEAHRTKVEKVLKARQDEITRMQEDCIKWDEEREAALEALHKLEDEAEARKQEAEDMGKNKKKELEPILSELGNLEEEIRTLSLSIKSINDEEEKLKEKETEDKPKPVDVANPSLAGLAGVPPLARGPSFPGEPDDTRIEREWQARFKALELRYMEILGHFRAAQDEFFRSEHQLRAWHARRASLPAPQSDSSTSTLSLNKGKSKQRRNRTRKNRTQTVSSPMSAYPISDLPYMPVSIPFNQPPTPSSTTGPNQTSPPFPSLLPAAPLFSYPNGLDPMFSPDIDKLTGGAPMSPTADSLLPSNLFMSMDEVPPSPKGSTYLLDSQAFPTSDNIQPLIPAAQSPVSSNSMSNSQLSSPRTSFPHIPVFSMEESERLNRSNSISSVNNSLRGIPPPMPEEPVPPKKIFPNLFSFTRPRGKTLSNETPALGSLKASQSNSFPKQDGPGLDPIGTRRRSGSHGTSWMSASGLGFLSNGSNIKRTLNNANGSKSSFNHFDPESDPLDPSRLLSKEPLSPRPSSISSFGESILPKPSADFSAFGWPARDNTAVRASPLAANWADIPNINNSSYLIPSLPPSPQTSPPTTHPSRLAKIFSSKSSNHNSNHNNAGAVGQPIPSNAKLNPAAPTFDAYHNNSNNSSSPSSHQHAETQSLNTESSFASSASLDQLALTTSITSVDKESSAAGSSVGKESLLSRIGLSRKGSHTKLVGGPGATSSPKLGSPAKFTISSPFKKEGGLFGRKKGENSTAVTTPTADVIDEEGGGLSGVLITALDTSSSSALPTPTTATGIVGTPPIIIEEKEGGKEKEKGKEGKSGSGKKGHGSSGSIGSASELFGSWRRESSEVLSSPFKKEGGFFGVIGGNKKKRGNLGVVDAMTSTSEVEEDEGLVMVDGEYHDGQHQNHQQNSGKIKVTDRDREFGATGGGN
ncbi:hypothetical protein H072_9393 [Dactylellina haptotyla CBS 200.50]|uniref:Fibronectin type-III domain-containing protein n=1 Tax=Dactylellina haptotyla (strain CBS 200.50) TaxID=1284197 RepID=S8BCS4_DACHA|nr:hypothetical protein H072_9393 [Dactylellina haptotyla CBS 200.50]